MARFPKKIAKRVLGMDHQSGRPLEVPNQEQEAPDPTTNQPQDREHPIPPFRQDPEDTEPNKEQHRRRTHRGGVHRRAQFSSEACHGKHDQVRTQPTAQEQALDPPFRKPLRPSRVRETLGQGVDARWEHGITLSGARHGALLQGPGRIVAGHNEHGVCPFRSCYPCAAMQQASPMKSNAA